MTTTCALHPKSRATLNRHLALMLLPLKNTTIAMLLILGIFLATPQAYGGSRLSSCYGSNPDKWTNCIGTRYYPGGNKYVGEYRNGRANGLGTFTFADGKPSLEGIWVDDKFIRPEKVELQLNPSMPKGGAGLSGNEKQYPTLALPASSGIKKCGRMGLLKGTDDYNLCVASQK